MSNKDIILTSSVSAGGSNLYETPVIPGGEIWVLKVFGACDINLGDNKSSVYVLKFGSDIIRIISLTGNTKEIAINEEITGDGVKKVGIIRYNKSGFDKELPCWVTAYQRGS